MLDITTKQKIDSLRNLLVGKVPDPKSQVEQITVALFYKFMWDRDKEIKDLGGNATFFVGEFEKYSWDNLFAPDLGGSDRIKLYSEAIEEMENNPNIPSIFRDIFKRAFLPYNDPYTLKLFLSDINDFHYSNSEKLGDGFEYLLSILGTQGDAGQFRTPRHIIDFITEVVNPQKGDRIVDPACGTAGFIISAYKHILKTNTKESLGDLLTPEDKKRLGNNLVGLDIDPMMVKLALANMYLHGLNEPHIYEYDSLTSEERWDEMYDVVLANPPFMTPKGGIRPHKRFAVNANKAEVLFTSYINTHLSNSGRAGIVVPEGVIFGGENAYKDLRKQLIQSSLVGVISLPSGVFKPYSAVKTSILLLDKALNKKTDKIFFAKVKNDGFELGDNRTPIEDNDLPALCEAIIQYCRNPDDRSVKEHSIVNCISKNEILRSSDFGLTYERYVSINENSDFKIVNLKEYVDFKRGTSITKKMTKPGEYPVIAGGQSPAYFHNKFNREGETITVSSSGAYAGFINYFDKPIFISDSFSIKSIDKNILSTKFLYFILKGKQKNIYKLQTGAAQPHVYAKNFDNFKIPLPPIDFQREIVNELEQYEKVIDGVKQVLENYKPQFEIDDNWDKIELGEISTLKYGLGESALNNGEYRFIRISDIDSAGQLKNDDKKYINITENNKEYVLSHGDILMARTGATYGKCLYFEGAEKSVYAGYLIKISLDQRLILNRYFWYYTQSFLFEKQKKQLVTGGGQPQFNANTIKKLIVPIPKIDVQKNIIDLLQKERKIIDNNIKLIEIYSKKIENRINKIWGE